jgi:ElaB/YqjD/DUF883 family membrane-anchored ribosome-binding protein
MKGEVLDKVIGAGATARKLGVEVGRVKEAVADAVEDEISAARRAVKQGRRSAEDLIDDAEYQVKQRPLNKVGVSFGVGLGLGALIGALLARNAHRGK